jgi:Zn-dependent protease
MPHYYFWAGVAFLAFIQLTATILNLIPVPGLDGGGAIRPWLKPPYDRYYDVIAPWGMMLLILILVASPQGNAAFFNVVQWIGSLFGLPFDAALQGRALFPSIR